MIVSWARLPTSYAIQITSASMLTSQRPRTLAVSQYP